MNAKRVGRTGCEPCAKCRRAARVGDQPRAWGAERVECARRPWAPLITLHQMSIPGDPDRRGDPTPWYHFMAETVPPRPERSQPKKVLAFFWTKLVLFGIERPDHQKCLDFSMLRFFLEPKRYFFDAEMLFVRLFGYSSVLRRCSSGLRSRGLPACQLACRLPSLRYLSVLK